MQQDQTKVNSLQKVESRVRNARTPDRSDVRQKDVSILSVGSPRRKLHVSRQSVSTLLNSTNINLRKLEVENYNLDLELAYSEYISSNMEIILEKENLQSTEKQTCNSIKNLCEETNILSEKCKLIETRIRDVKASSYLSDYKDKITIFVNNFYDELKNNDIKSILFQLEKLLNRFNILRCENIILPTNSEEMEELNKILVDCYDILNKISDPKECEALEYLTTNYKEFITLFQEISHLKQIIEDEISNIQSETLKICSQMFSQNSI